MVDIPATTATEEIVMDTVEKLNAVYDRNKAFVTGQFHNALWQLMVNESFGTSTAVFAESMSEPGTIILACESGGYVPACCGFRDGVPEHRREEVLNDLNASVFGVTPERAFTIEARSYGNNRKRRA